MKTHACPFQGTWPVMHMPVALVAWPIWMGGIRQVLLALPTFHRLLVSYVPSKTPFPRPDVLGKVILVPVLSPSNWVMAGAAHLGCALSTPTAASMAQPWWLHIEWLLLL